MVNLQGMNSVPSRCTTDWDISVDTIWLINIYCNQNQLAMEKSKSVRENTWYLLFKKPSFWNFLT